MPKLKDRVLIVDDDPEVRDLLMDQIFSPRQFEVHEARDGVEGLEMVSKRQPDLIYLDLIMPGLTGKDMLVGVKARNFQGPIIVGVKRGNEQSAIEAFRFGATDYITKPIREAEMMSVVSRAMKDVHLLKERQQLMDQLQNTNAQLESHNQHLTTLQNLGKTLTAMYSLDEMFDAVLAGAIEVSNADHATLILYDEPTGGLILRAGKNMTLVMQEKLGEPINDELARLVMTSQEPVVIEGDGLKRFKVSRDIHATIYAPMVVHGKAIGVLTAGNHRKRKSFDESLGVVVDALADYAAIALVNARLFVALDNRARTAYAELQERDQQLAAGLGKPLEHLQQRLDQMADISGIPEPFKVRLIQMSQQTQQMQKFVAHLMPSNTAKQ